MPKLEIAAKTPPMLVERGLCGREEPLLAEAPCCQFAFRLRSCRLPEAVAVLPEALHVY